MKYSNHLPLYNFEYRWLIEGMASCRLPADEHKRLIENIVGILKKVLKEIQIKMVDHIRRAYQNYGNGIAKGLGL